MESKFRVQDWSIVPGPRKIRPPFDSTDLREITDTAPEQAASAALSLRDVTLERAGEPEWWNWCSFWRFRDSEIALSMTLFETDPPTWGGFSLSGSATAGDLLQLYREVHDLLPNAWLHNDLCELHTAESFALQHVHAG